MNLPEAASPPGGCGELIVEDLYRDNIIDHYQNPRNYGTLEHPDISYEDSNPVCGDEIRMDLQDPG